MASSISKCCIIFSQISFTTPLPTNHPFCTFSSFQRPTTTNLTVKFYKASKVVENLSLTAHSARDGIEGEQYPDHLKGIVQIYSKLKEGAETQDSLTASQENRINQNALIGDASPTGQNTNATCRASTTAKHKKDGMYSVPKLKEGHVIGITASTSTSFDCSSDENAPAPAPTQKENMQRKELSKKSSKRHSTK